MKRAKLKTEDLMGSLFEENYLVRTLGHIAHDPEIALRTTVFLSWTPCLLNSQPVPLTLPR
ncbi:protein of unknown function (plasmid) [Pararobbsia alpina]